MSSGSSESGKHDGGAFCRGCPRRVVIAAAVLALLLIPSCRDPATTDGPTTDDTDSFTDVPEDDAGPGSLCPPGTPDLFNNSMSPYIGGTESVDLEVVHFSFFRCPHCADFAVLEHDLWYEDRPDFMKRVRIYFHHYPFEGATNYAVHAAAVAAFNQGMEHFWAMHDHIYAGMNADEPVIYDPEDLAEFAENELGLDMAQYEEDVSSEYTLDFLKWDKGQGQAAGVSGTPSVFICGEKISWGDIEDVVDSYLNP